MHSVEVQIAALNNLIGGVNIAQKRGTYTLAEAANLHNSIGILVQSLQNPAPQEVATPVEVEDSEEETS